MIGRLLSERRRQDTGAALILALVFILAMGLVLVAILNLTTNNLLNTTNLRSQRSVEFAADSATNASVQWVRNSCAPSSAGPCHSIYGAPTGSPANCLPSAAPYMTINGVKVSVWCSGSGQWPSVPGGASVGQRQVEFFTCPSAVPNTGCNLNSPNGANVLVHATILYFDANLDGSDTCVGTSTTSCGIAISIKAWDVRPADN